LHLLYFYGFASGPLSNKAQFFKGKFHTTTIHFHIIDYIPNQEAFTQLRVSNVMKDIQDLIERKHAKDKVILFGSSFGAMIASWLAFKFPEKVNKLILIAPALYFTANFIANTLGTTPSKWKTNNSVLIDHYRFNRAIPLNYTFYSDLNANPIPIFPQKNFPIPTIILHGVNDEVVPIKWSENFAKENPNVNLFPFEGDHQLLEYKEEMWTKIKEFLAI
jgi:pimeloyl-ACP methyl ester carboxylesterase